MTPYLINLLISVIEFFKAFNRSTIKVKNSKAKENYLKIAKGLKHIPTLKMLAKVQEFQCECNEEVDKLIKETSGKCSDL